MQVSSFIFIFFICVSNGESDFPISSLSVYDAHIPETHFPHYILKLLIFLAAKDKRSKKQYRRDQTERRQKRIERSKAKGASKDVWGLRREGVYRTWLCLSLFCCRCVCVPRRCCSVFCYGKIATNGGCCVI